LRAAKTEAPIVPPLMWHWLIITSVARPCVCHERLCVCVCVSVCVCDKILLVNKKDDVQQLLYITVTTPLLVALFALMLMSFGARPSNQCLYCCVLSPSFSLCSLLQATCCRTYLLGCDRVTWGVEKSVVHFRLYFDDDSTDNNFPRLSIKFSQFTKLRRSIMCRCEFVSWCLVLGQKNQRKMSVLCWSGDSFLKCFAV